MPPLAGGKFRLAGANFEGFDVMSMTGVTMRTAARTSSSRRSSSGSKSVNVVIPTWRVSGLTAYVVVKACTAVSIRAWAMPLLRLPDRSKTRIKSTLAQGRGSGTDICARVSGVKISPQHNDRVATIFFMNPLSSRYALKDRGLST